MRFIPYWIIESKEGKYISGIDENDYPLYTEDKDNALKFYDYNNIVLSYYNLGYSIHKEYEYSQ